MYFTQHCGVKYKVYAGMPNPDKHIVQNPLGTKIQARWSGIYINRLRRMCKAAQENCFLAYSLQISDTRGSRSFLIMIKRHTSLVGSLNIKQGQNTEFIVWAAKSCLAGLVPWYYIREYAVKSSHL